MGKRLPNVQGHPDATAAHFCQALAQAYADDASAGGHDVRWADVARLDFPLLRGKAEWEHGTLPPGLQKPQEATSWAQHLVFAFSCGSAARRPF